MNKKRIYLITRYIHEFICSHEVHFPTLALPKSGAVETIVSSQPVHKLPIYLIFEQYNTEMYNNQYKFINII